MDTPKSYTPEELQKMIEKAQADLQAQLDKMTPEERAQAERRAKQLIAEDAASMQKMIDEAAAVAGGMPVKEAPKFCTNCGAPAGNGRFCAYCGSALS